MMCYENSLTWCFPTIFCACIGRDGLHLARSNPTQSNDALRKFFNMVFSDYFLRLLWSRWDLYHALSIKDYVRPQKRINKENWVVDELTHVSRKLDDASRKLELLLVHVLFRRLDNTSRKLEPLPVHFLYRQLNNAPKTRSMCPFMFSHGGSMIHQGDASSK